MKNTVLILGGCCSLWTGAYAQDTLQVKKLKEVIIREQRQGILPDTLSGTLKLGGSLISVPQNIISIGHVLLQQQGVFDLTGALRNAPGFYAPQGGVFDAAGSITSRGLTPVTIIRNGMPAGDTYKNGVEDAAIIEGIDFIKGPAAFLGSAGEASGAINVVTKTPRKARLLDVQFTGGSFGFYRAAVDVSSAVKERGFSWRFNTALQQQQFFQDYVKKNKWVIAPVVQYNFSRRTWLLAEYNGILSRAKNGTDFTRVATEGDVLKDRRANNYMADPGLPVSAVNEHYTRLYFQHQFSDNWKIVSQSSWKFSPAEIWSMYSENTFSPVAFDPAGKARRVSFNENKRNMAAVTQLYINGQFRTGKHIRHQLMAGLDYAVTVDSTIQTVGAKAFPFDKTNLQYGLNTDSLRVPGNVFAYHTRNNWLAGYLFNTATFFDIVQVSVGGRFTANTVTRRSKSAPVNKTSRYRAFSPRAAISVMPVKSLNIYVLYDESFQPQGGQDANGKNFEPQYGKNLEAGVKKEWGGGLLSTGITAFHTIKDNVFAFDATTSRLTQLGRWRVKGIETSILGALNKNWSVSANYMLLSGKITRETDPEKLGKRFSGGPEQQLNIWLRYAVRTGALKGLAVGLGQVSVFRNGTSSTPGEYLYDYTKFDGSISYERNRYTFRLLLDNLANKRYVSSGDIRGDQWFYQEGTPFNGKLQVGIRLW